MSFTPLFPPELGPGSMDTGDNGPVRKLQNMLIENRPRLAELIGLRADGDYGDRTKIMVGILQDEALRDGTYEESEGFVVDGACGNLTRAHLGDLYGEDPNTIEFVEGGGCRYIGPGMQEVAVWPPEAALAAAAPIPEAEPGAAGQHLGCGCRE